MMPLNEKFKYNGRFEFEMYVNLQLLEGGRRVEKVFNRVVTNNVLWSMIGMLEREHARKRT